MDDRTMPPPTSCALVRSCEISRLQHQLLARAYQQVCPENRKALQRINTTAQRSDPGCCPTAAHCGGRRLNHVAL
jgi:hypothetical protein